MSGCEHHEASVSAWLDGELDREGGLEVVDHLVRCAGCREFYLDARVLDGAVGVLRSGADRRARPAGRADDLGEVWGRIERKVERPRASPARIPWFARIAALLVLGAGLAGLLWSTGQGAGVAPRADDAMIALGEDAGRMSEERFLDLTGEILRADPRYHAEMFRVMRQIVEETTAEESVSDIELAGSASGERPTGEVLRRDPV
jgi:hypothetical protein